MEIHLSVEQHAELADALHESAEIARLYRERIADEDSIVLLQDIERIAQLLGIVLRLGLEGGPAGPSAADAAR